MKGRAKSGSQKLRAKEPGSWELGAEEFPALIFNRLFGSSSAPMSGSLAPAPLQLSGSQGAAPKIAGSPALLQLTSHNHVTESYLDKKYYTVHTNTSTHI